MTQAVFLAAKAILVQARFRPNRIAPALLLAVSLAGCGSESSSLVDRSAGPPNLILIGLDTVRADHLGCYGNTVVETPHLDAFAREAILFEDCAAAATWTLPAFAALFTGRLPFEHAAIGGDHKVLRTALPTLAEILSEYGFATKAHIEVDWLGTEFGLHRGFADLRSHLSGSPARRDQALREDVFPFLRNAPAEPYFLFVHYFDAHTPYAPPAPFAGMYYEGDPTRQGENSIAVIYEAASNQLQRSAADRYAWLENITDLRWPVQQYAAEITHLDQIVGELLSVLRQSGQLERSIVVITADHGEHLTEHGIYFTHRFPYQECLHVPLLIRLPQARQGGRRVPESVSGLDLLPTMLELLGLAAPAPLDGSSLVPLLAGRDDWPQRVLFAEYGAGLMDQARAAWDESHRLLRFSVDGREWEELYDRRADRAEVRPLDEARSEAGNRLRAALAARFGELAPLLSPVEAALDSAPPDAETLERLRALGYIE